MDLKLDCTTFAIEITCGSTVWRTADSFVPRLCYGGSGGVGGVRNITQTVLFSQAGCITEQAFDTGFGSGKRLILSDFEGPAKGLSFELLVWRETAAGTVRCEWIPLTEGAQCPTAVYWPGPMAFDEGRHDWTTLLNEQQGWLIPNDHPVATSRLSFSGYLCTAGSYMPWFAQLKQNQALLTICETPWNAAVDADHPAGGPYTHVSIHWESSLGQMADRRVLQLVCLEGDHNTVCKAYRRYARAKGTLVTLKQKAVLNPSVDKLAGCCWLHTGIKTMVQPNSEFFDPQAPEKNNHLVSFAFREQQLRELKTLGVDKLYLHLDGWAEPGYDNRHPDYGPVCKAAGGEAGMRALALAAHECGYLFGIHDQYRDFYESAPSFDQDLAVRLPEGGIPRHARWAGGPQSYLCGSQAPFFVRRNFDALAAAGIRLDGAYLDVFTCNEGDECSNPRHRVTREDCYEHRRSCFRELLCRDILPSSEEVNDWAMPELVFCHYAPYGFQLAEPGAPKRGIPLPLFNLIYHDCVVIPWMMDRISDTEDYMLYALQNGGAPYLIRDAAYPNIDGAFEGEALPLNDAIDRCRKVQQLHERVCFEEMLSVRLLNPEGSEQQIQYAGGTTVTIDFDRQTCQIIYP